VTKDLVKKCVRSIYVSAIIAMFELKHDCHFELILNATHHNQLIRVVREVALRLNLEARLQDLVEILLSKKRVRFYLAERLYTPIFYLFHVILSFSLHDQSHSFCTVCRVEKFLEVFPKRVAARSDVLAIKQTFQIAPAKTVYWVALFSSVFP
jgi:hypothetical protein